MMKVSAEREGPLRSGKVKLKLKKVEEIPRVTWEGVWWGIGEVAAFFFFWGGGGKQHRFACVRSSLHCH